MGKRGRQGRGGSGGLSYGKYRAFRDRLVAVWVMYERRGGSIRTNDACRSFVPDRDDDRGVICG